MLKQAISTIGVTVGRRGGQIFGIRQRDSLQHLFVVGQTGTGKSSLLQSMVRQDMDARRGFCLIDPHGDLADAVVKNSQSLGRENIYWNVADPNCPYGYNPLAKVTDAHRPVMASGLIETLKKQWPEAWGVRMEHLLRFALLALLERENSSLEDIVPLFLDKEFRAEVLEDVSDEAVRQFWTVEFKALRYQSSADGVASIANKLSGLLAHPLVRKALCQPVTPLHFRQLMDEGQGLVVNLSKGRLGADISNILGGLIVSGLAHAGYRRQDTPEMTRQPFFVYLDEFHNFTTRSFVDMLSELRKYGLALTLTTQYIARLEDAVREAIFGNVGTLVSFRVGASDAAQIAKQFGIKLPEPADLVNLPNYEMYVKLMIDGSQSKPFSARTLPPRDENLWEMGVEPPV